MKTILLPTDFTIESLHLFKAAAQTEESEKINVIFVHCIRLSDSILDLLFSSHQKKITELEKKDFQDACKILCRKYESKLNSVREEIFRGVTQSAFMNFLEANRVDEIYVPRNYVFKMTSKYSVDPMPYILESQTKMIYVDWNPAQQGPEQNEVAALFQR